MAKTTRVSSGRKTSSKGSRTNQGGSGSLRAEGKEQSLADLTKADFMYQPDVPDKPSFKKTKFPVMMDKYRRMKDDAKKPAHEEASKAFAPGAKAKFQGNEDKEPKTVIKEYPEDGVFMSKGPVSLAPASGGASFDTLTDTGYLPPDCTIAVGKNDVLVGVNVDMAGYSKTGVLNFKWAGFTSLFGSVLPSGASLFDPKMAYDHYSDRYIVVAAALKESPDGSWLMVAVSKTNNPGGSYWVWAIDATKDGGTSTSNWSDYPCLGFDTQAIYITTNQFSFAGSDFKYAKIRVLNKAELYAGGVGSTHAIKWYDFYNLKDTNGDPSFTIQPCVHYRGTGGDPSAYFVNNGWGKNAYLTLWQMDHVIAYWSGGAPTLSKTNIPCLGYNLPPDADQPSTSINIETNDNRVLAAAFQYSGGTQRVWACHTSKTTWSGDTVARAVLQWYEIDVVSKTIIQQNYFGAAGNDYFYPAITVDANKNAYLVFSRSSSSEYGSVRQTGRKSTDAAGSMQSSALVKAGESKYTGGRWGDYFGICRDGADNTKVWAIGEYADAGNRWGTWVFSVKF